MSSYKKGIILTILVWVLMAFLSALVKDASRVVSPTVILFFQYFVSFLFILPFVLGTKISLVTHEKNLIFIRSFLGVLEYLLFFWAIAFVPLIDATLLLNTAPLFVPILMFFLLRYKINHKLWVPLAIGFIGVICVLKPGIEILQLGSILALIAGIAQAGIMISLRQASKESPFRVTFYYLLTGTIALFPFLLIYWKVFPAYIYLEMFGIGAIFALVQYLFTKSFQFGSAAELAPFSYIFVIVSALLDWWFWGHVPSLLTWIGTLLVMTGSIFTIRRRTKAL